MKTPNSPSSLSDAELEQIVLDAKLASVEQLAEARRRIGEFGGALYNVLIEDGIADEQELVAAVAAHLKLPHENLRRRQRPSDNVLILVSGPDAWTMRCLPLELVANGSEKRLRVAMVDPFDRETLDLLKTRARTSIDPVLVGPEDLAQTLERIFGSDSGPLRKLDPLYGVAHVAVDSDALVKGHSNEPIDPGKRVLQKSARSFGEGRPLSSSSEKRKQDKPPTTEEHQRITPLDHQLTMLANEHGEHELAKAVVRLLLRRGSISTTDLEEILQHSLVSHEEN